MARRRNGRRTFTPEYKAGIVAEWENGERPLAAIVKREKLDRTLVYGWKRQYGNKRCLPPGRALARSLTITGPNGNAGQPVDFEQVMRHVSREIAFAAAVRALVAKYAGEEKS